MWFIVVSGVLIGFASYMMTPEERVRALAALRAYAGRFADMARGGSQPFGKALAERTPWPLVAPAIGALCVIVFLSITLGFGSSGNDRTLAWGANIGPLTTNGEWYRLVFATFVHPHPVDLVATLAGLAAFGIIAERLIGSAAFATVFISATIVASLVSLHADPLRLSYGASGAVFGIYGCLLAAACRVFVTTKAPLIPWHIFRPLAPVAGMFVLYALVAPSLMAKAEFAAALTGLVCGIALSKDIQQGKPTLKQSGRLVGATAAVTIAAAFMLAGIDDGRPEVAAVTALEERTARQYEKEIDRYRAGGSSADHLIRTIEKMIVPELQAAQQRIEQLDRVPAEQRPSIDHTNEYLRQRRESWRLRVDGLRQRAILEARQAGRKTPSPGPALSANQLLEKSTTSLLSAEGAERSALKDLRAAAAILQ